MTSSEVRQKYLDFFVKREHKVVPSSSLVPENDPTTLFTGSGMQPMIQYLLGAEHPLGKRIVNSQVVFRSQDIEEIGDNRHDTLFEMLGNWSLGDYFKKEQLEWFFEFLTLDLKLDPQRIYVTVFAGDEKLNIPKDQESVNIWVELFAKKNIQAKIVEMGSLEEASEKGISDGRIFYYDAAKNWWSRSGTPDNMPSGEPGGPDSEVFYLFEKVEHDPKFGEKCHPNCDCGRFVEIGNSVFMQYKKIFPFAGAKLQKQADGSFKELPQKNVDFGGGLERMLMAVNNQPDMFKNDLHWPIIEYLVNETGNKYEDNEANFRVIADHIKAATFLIKNGVIPSNKQQGYVLRRLLRRSAVKLSYYDLDFVGTLSELSGVVIDIYQDTNYFQSPSNRHSGEDQNQTEVGSWSNQDDRQVIKLVIKEELEKFEKTIKKGLSEIKKLTPVILSEAKNLGKIAFDLYQTYGFPLELTTEIVEEKGLKLDKKQFEEEFKKHQELSRTTSAGSFKGGLADSTEETTKLHTANHLMQAALRVVLGEHVRQRGSNITAERLRFDFSHSEKLTDEEIKKVENLVNQKIRQDLPVSYEIKEREQAIREGALSNYGETYPELAKVYKIGNQPSVTASERNERGNLNTEIASSQTPRNDDDIFSMELCGGPHVENTGSLGNFKILKQENLGSGLRRIYAAVE